MRVLVGAHGSIGRRNSQTAEVFAQTTCPCALTGVGMGDRGTNELAAEAARPFDGADAGEVSRQSRLRDAALVRRCRRGDESAWAALVERFSSYVYAIVTRGFGLDGTAAEDVFQEVFTTVFRRLETLEEDGAIRAWIAQVARRAAIDRIRATRTESDIDSVPDAGALDPGFALIEQAMTVHRALAELPEPYRDVLERFFMRDQSYRVIAAELALAPGTIASRISRGLSMLRSSFEETAEVAGSGSRA
jgi:RNA polymerase sigma factor (sigma-70 family)